MHEWLNEDGLVASPDYAAAMQEIVLPALSRIRKDHTLSAKDGTSLFCSVFEAEEPRGTVLVLHGFTENMLKYSELIFSLLNCHFSVVAYDQRGHGLSGRAEGLSDPSVTHVERFSDYVDDLRLVCETLLQDMPKPRTIFAHSMGGAVAALYLEQFPETFSTAALCAPMIAPNTGVPAAAAAVLCRFFCRLGSGKHYPFFMKPYAGPEDFGTSCATDPVRFAWYDAIKAAHPEYQNSIPSYRWTIESIQVTERILAPGAPERIACPVFLSTADQDFSVMPEPQKTFISRVPKGRHLFVPASRHEIFRSVNEVFFPWWHEVLTFLQEAAS